MEQEGDSGLEGWDGQDGFETLFSPLPFLLSPPHLSQYLSYTLLYSLFSNKTCCFAVLMACPHALSFPTLYTLLCCRHFCISPSRMEDGNRGCSMPYSTCFLPHHTRHTSLPIYQSEKNSSTSFWIWDYSHPQERDSNGRSSSSSDSVHTLWVPSPMFILGGAHRQLCWAACFAGIFCIHTPGMHILAGRLTSPFPTHKEQDLALPTTTTYLLFQAENCCAKRSLHHAAGTPASKEKPSLMKNDLGMHGSQSDRQGRRTEPWACFHPFSPASYPILRRRLGKPSHLPFLLCYLLL